MSTKAMSAKQCAIREIRPADSDDCARIIYEGFGGLHDYHRFPRDLPTLEAASQLANNLIAHRRIWGIVAEADGKIVGSNFLDERGPIRGVGPLTVAPEVQGPGVGRHLMTAVIERGAESRGIRLFQDSFNMSRFRCTPRWASTSGNWRWSCTAPRSPGRATPSTCVRSRRATSRSASACAQECTVFERTAELLGAIRAPVFSPFVAVRDGRITAYATKQSSKRCLKAGHGGSGRDC
jgi:GNAT superfamily N-acetyltransferase